MSKDTSVLKLKRASNLAIWLFRLEKHMTAKGTWDAVRFVPYCQCTRESTTPQADTSSTPRDSLQYSIREITKTSPRHYRVNLERKTLKFSSKTNY